MLKNHPIELSVLETSTLFDDKFFADSKNDATAAILFNPCQEELKKLSNLKCKAFILTNKLQIEVSGRDT